MWKLVGGPKKEPILENNLFQIKMLESLTKIVFLEEKLIWFKIDSCHLKTSKFSVENQIFAFFERLQQVSTFINFNETLGYFSLGTNENI